MSAMETRMKQMLESMLPGRNQMFTAPTPQHHPQAGETRRTTLGPTHTSHLEDMSNPIPQFESGRKSDFKLKRNRAFKDILASPVLKYDGKNRLGFRPWMDALRRETADLDLEASQWLDLLEVRTSGTALDLVQSARLIQFETSPQQALEKVWEYLDQQFSSPHQPSQQLLRHLLHGARITPSDPTALTTFARHCDSAVYLRRCNPGCLPSLDESTNQLTLFQRLSPDLNYKWQEFRCANFPGKGPIPFETFARWITTQSQICLHYQETQPNDEVFPQTPSSKLKGSGNLQAQSSLPTFHSPASPNQARRANPHSSSRNPNGSNTPSQNQWVNSSGRYPTGVGKPMHESSRASSPVKSSQSQDQKPIFCAWCRENGVTHSHDTSNCTLIREASALDQWKVLYNHRICTKCLLTGHYYKECTAAKRCETCRGFHHEAIHCRPLETISSSTKRD